MRSVTETDICCEKDVMTELADPGIVEGDKDLPLMACSVTAGFPSPADDHIESRLDLNELMIKRPSSTFIFRVGGDAMIKAGIFEDDKVIVDRSITPRDGMIVIADIDGEATIRRLSRTKGKTFLIAENDVIPPTPITDGHELVIFGVVTGVIRQL
jgi:DNA polymerase V